MPVPLADTRASRSKGGKGTTVMKVLVVDDRDEEAYYLRVLLSAHGYEVRTARHGAEALVRAREEPPELVISDLLMPVMDGYTLLRRWRLDERLKSVPFVVYTATYTDPDDEELARQLGADAFILKPAEPAALLEKVRTVRTRPRAVEGPTEASDETGILRQYSEALIRKLEGKSLELEESNRRLQRDIAARQAAEAALRESEERLRQLAESIDDIFWLSDLESRIIYMSPAFEAIWGIPEARMSEDSRVWLQHLHPDDRERIKASLARYASGSWDETFRIVRPDGTIRCLRARAYPVRDKAGKVYRVAGVARDITDYRLLEDQLRQAQKLEAIGQLAGGVAHDFNNLLSLILSYTSLALNELKSDSPVRGDLEEIRRAGERAAQLTRQLLAFSRQQVLQPRVIDLRRVVRDMQNMLRRLLGEDIVCTLLLSGGGSGIYADPSQVEQVVMNLAVNARDAMPRGGTLTIEVADVELDPTYAAAQADIEPGSYVMLAVTDTGEGMSKATLERIFEPFFTTKEVGKGTGLGLATVFGIVKQSLGHIRVVSQPGMGTTFKIFFPKTQQVVEQVPPSSQTPLVDARGTETVLVVEDDDRVRELTCSILRRSGYEVIDAQNAGEAFLLSERMEQPIHLLVTDMVMPRLSGRELAERLVQSRPEMKVLYVTGHPRDAALGRGSGAALLRKPITPASLLCAVRQLLDGSA